MGRAIVCLSNLRSRNLKERVGFIARLPRISCVSLDVFLFFTRRHSHPRAHISAFPGTGITKPERLE